MSKRPLRRALRRGGPAAVAASLMWGGLLPPSSLGRVPAAVKRVDLAPGRPSADAWPQFHNTADRVGVNPDRTGIGVSSVGRLGLKYSLQFPGAIAGSPVVAGGLVYFGAGDGRIRAVDAGTGEIAWTYRTGAAVKSTPAVAGTSLYIGSSDGYIYALDAATGAFLWRAGIGGDVNMAMPLVFQGLVYIGSSSGDFSAFDAATGERVWRRNTWKVRGSAAGAGGIVYVGSDRKRLWALDARTGRTRWTASAGALLGGTPSVLDGVVYVGADDFRVYAFDAATGTQRWKTAPFPNAGKVRSAPAVANGMVYIATSEGTEPGDHGGHTWGLDADTGAIVWKKAMADMSESSPAVVNGVVFNASYDDQLYAFDATTGRKLWTSGFHSMKQIGRESPAIADDVVYLTGLDGRLYAFEDLPGAPVGDVVSITDGGYNPSVLPGHRLGTATLWRNVGELDHTVTDSTGLGLFDSGVLAPGATFTFAFAGAGQYRYRDTLHPDLRGSVKAPVTARPRAGGVGTLFTITWAASDPPPGYVYDVQVRRPRAGGWQGWRLEQSRASAQFRPDAGTGRYSFRGRLRRVDTGASSGWSGQAEVVVR